VLCSFKSSLQAGKNIINGCTFLARDFEGIRNACHNYTAPVSDFTVTSLTVQFIYFGLSNYILADKFTVYKHFGLYFPIALATQVIRAKRSYIYNFSCFVVFHCTSPQFAETFFSKESV
jgi:hypothetical protein